MKGGGRFKPYSELGKVLGSLARRRHVRGPYNIAWRVREITDYKVSGQMVSIYLYGQSLSRRVFIGAFCDAFELTEQERSELAWTYTYGDRPEVKARRKERKEPTIV
jgi:hypothetical protein